MIQKIPIALIIFRLFMGPLILWDATDGHTTIWFLIGYLAAFISDIFDGIIARKLGISTPELRQADSWADIALYVCIAISAWLVYPQILINFKIPLLSVVFCQLLWWIVNLVKYGKPASYHTYSAKLWGISLALTIIALFGFNQADIFLWISIIIGIIHTIEEIAMTLILPEWHHDILSLVHAWELRKTQL